MIRRLSVAYLANAKGSVAVVFGLAVPMLIGFSGLAVDGTFWLKERNKLQSATDSSAITAAQALQLDGAAANLTAEAKDLFAKAFGAQSSKVRLTVQHPPLSGVETGNNQAVAVLSETDQDSFFLSVFGVDKVLVKARAVAKIDGMSDACLLSLSKTEDKAIEITGNATTSLGCGLASNSNSPEAIYLSGNSTTTVSGLSSVGDIYQMNNAKLITGEGTIKTYAQEMSDPYGPEGRNLKVPTTPTGCTANKLKSNGNTTLQPGRYCGGIDFQSGTTTLEPGVYIMDAGDFNANAQAKIVGINVTIILTASNNNNIGRMQINGGASIELNAPKSGTPYDGILFFQDPDAPKMKGGVHNTNVMNGNSDLKLSGAMYFPNQEVRFTGGSGTNISCLQIVADTVRIDGNSAVSGTCPASSGTSRITRQWVKLVE